MITEAYCSAVARLPASVFRCSPRKFTEEAAGEEIDHGKEQTMGGSFDGWEIRSQQRTKNGSSRKRKGNASSAAAHHSQLARSAASNAPSLVLSKL